MKKFLLLFALAFTMPTHPPSAYAGPFLVCNSVPKPTDPSQTITSYTIQGLPAVNVSVPAATNSDGSVQLHYDLGTLANGSYSVTATATNSWGTSAASAPFSFSKALPAVPGSLSVTGN